MMEVARKGISRKYCIDNNGCQRKTGLRIMQV